MRSFDRSALAYDLLLGYSCLSAKEANSARSSNDAFVQFSESADGTALNALCLLSQNMILRSSVYLDIHSWTAQPSSTAHDD